MATINVYLCANALLVVACVLMVLLRWLSKKMQRPVAYRDLLWIGYGLSLAVLLLPLIRLSAPDAMPSALQVWSAPSMHGADIALDNSRVALPLASAAASVSLSAVATFAVVLYAAGIMALLVRVVRDAICIVRIVGGAQTLRRHHGSRLLVSDLVSVPFSVWIPGSRIVVIPSALVPRLHEMRMVIRHEIQHHRQYDTLWLYLFPLIKALFFWNPAAHWLARCIQELQEFACDAAVVSRRGVSASRYCHSLVWAAEHSMGATPLHWSASMIGNSGRKVLKRRVDALLNRPSQYSRNAQVLWMGIIAMTFMVVAATVSATTIQDQRVSLDEAMRMAATTPRGAIAIPVNDAVVGQLNRLLGTPDGRGYLNASLKRMQQYQVLMANLVAAHSLPLDLLAVPLVESGYRNLRQSGDPRHGAGLWMFIAPTARHFGLAVNGLQDQRNDPAAETDAALRMFASLYARYGDWGLTLLAYNCGVACVDKGVEEVGSRDVWALVARGHENDPDYVARVMAAMLILRTMPGAQAAE